MQNVGNQPLCVDKKERNMRQCDEGNHENCTVVHVLIAGVQQGQIQPNTPQTDVENDCFVFLRNNIFHQKDVVKMQKY